jgi:serine protease Do
MRRSFSPWLVALLLGTVACAAAPKQAPLTRLTPRQIIDRSSPAIVRIEAGDDKVGTGFVVDRSGLIATNLHVIAGESKILVKLYKDQTEYQATAIEGIDADRDLALLKIQPKQPLPVLALGDSDAVSAGDKVYAIGNPLGVFDYSITDGLISAVRPVSDDFTILQISAAISVGSSGGPLFDQYGQVIGVTTAIITAGQAINLAMPANYLKALMGKRVSMTVDEFARTTEEMAAKMAARRGADHDDQHISITRKIPVHPVTVWEGCTERDIDEVRESIGQAISNGAPLYNTGTREGFEACFRIYEGTALKYEKDAPCKGVREAFGDGLMRANTLVSYKEKAWAMRDTFDGLLDAFVNWCKRDPACVKKHTAP